MSKDEQEQVLESIETEITKIRDSRKMVKESKSVDCCQGMMFNTPDTDDESIFDICVDVHSKFKNEWLDEQKKIIKADSLAEDEVARFATPTGKYAWHRVNKWLDVAEKYQLLLKEQVLKAD